MPPSAYFTTSWDDGHPLDLRVAELLANYELPGTFYIPRQSQRPVMTEQEVKQISAGFEVGGHTLNHLDLTRLNDDEARAEIDGSRKWVQDLTGQPCRSFCFPLGRFRPNHVHYAREAGYAVGRTVELLSLAAPNTQSDLALMPTTLQIKNHAVGAYWRNAVKRRRPKAARRIYRWQVGQGWYEAFQKALADCLAQGGILHLWGHSWEIDAEQQWERLEDALRLVAAQRQTLSLKTNSAFAEASKGNHKRVQG